MIGTHKVEIEVSRFSPDEIVEMKAAGEEVSSGFVAIPKKYKADGALTADVKSGSNIVDFTLTSK